MQDLGFRARLGFRSPRRGEAMALLGGPEDVVSRLHVGFRGLGFRV